MVANIILALSQQLLQLYVANDEIYLSFEFNVQRFPNFSSFLFLLFLQEKSHAFPFQTSIFYNRGSTKIEVDFPRILIFRKNGAK